MPSYNSSWGAIISAHVTNAKGMKNGQKDGVYADFTKPGFAYSRLPLRGSPSQIREANHLMLQ